MPCTRPKGGGATFSLDELQALVAPIALYPDALLAQVLMAATFPLDVAEAARHVASSPTPTVPPIGTNWDASLIALLNYPTVLQLMDEDMDWTGALGEAFATQQADVFDAIQQFRREAYAAGNLQTTAQQRIMRETVQKQEIIKIEPANPQIIYVPTYQPQTVIVRQEPNVVAPLITFGTGLIVGAWLSNSFDWHHRRVHVHYHYSSNGWYHAGRPSYWRPMPYSRYSPRPRGYYRERYRYNYHRSDYRGYRPGYGGGAYRPGHGSGYHRPGSGAGPSHRPGSGGSVVTRPGAGGQQGGRPARPGTGGQQGGRPTRPGTGGQQGGRPARPEAGGQQGSRPDGAGAGGLQRPAPRPERPNQALGGQYKGAEQTQRESQRGAASRRHSSKSESGREPRR